MGRLIALLLILGLGGCTKVIDSCPPLATYDKVYNDALVAELRDAREKKLYPHMRGAVYDYKLLRKLVADCHKSKEGN